MSDPAKIALFGGSFDPPHRAHLSIAREACEQLGLDEVWFIPCRQSPHKEDAEPTRGEDRLRMLEEMTRDQEWSRVSDLELKREGLSYSIDTVRFFERQFPRARLFWLMGSDQWKVFDTWYAAEELSARVEFIVFPRPEMGRSQPGRKAYFMKTRIDMSSSDIRERIRCGESVAEFLDPGVEAFVRERGLYEGKGGRWEEGGRKT